ncbi:MAG: hypothetical protein ACI4TM_01530 [Candidatus Cryptobacteroides sp.]
MPDLIGHLLRDGIPGHAGNDENIMPGMTKRWLNGNDEKVTSGMTGST